MSYLTGNDGACICSASYSFGVVDEHGKQRHTMIRKDLAKLLAFKPLRMMDNEIVFIDLCSRAYESTDLFGFKGRRDLFIIELCSGIDDIISKLNGIFKADEKFWIYPKRFRSLKQYVETHGTRRPIYENHVLSKVKAEEFLTLDILRAIQKDIETSSGVIGKVEDPFLLNAKNICLDTFATGVYGIQFKLTQKLYDVFQSSSAASNEAIRITRILPPNSMMLHLLNSGDFKSIGDLIRQRLLSDVAIRNLPRKTQRAAVNTLKAAEKEDDYKEMLSLFKTIHTDDRLQFQPIGTFVSDIKYFVE